MLYPSNTLIQKLEEDQTLWPWISGDGIDLSKKNLSWNCKTLKKSYVIKKSFVLQIIQTWSQTGNLSAKNYWQLSEGSSRCGLLSKERRPGIWVWQQAWKDSTLTGTGTEKWYHMVPTKAEQSEHEDGDKAQLKTSDLQRSPWWWGKSKASQETKVQQDQRPDKGTAAALLSQIPVGRAWV